MLGNRGTAGCSPTRPAQPRSRNWPGNASAICTALAPVAQESGIFAENGFKVEFVNFGSSTEQLLEAIATGKADAGVGMVLRWPGHWSRASTSTSPPASTAVGRASLARRRPASPRFRDLVGKTIATADMASPGKNSLSDHASQERYRS
ncbi:MAG: hypothetical protein U0075_24710 [Thermomicrobiales bacterium]